MYKLCYRNFGNQYDQVGTSTVTIVESNTNGPTGTPTSTPTTSQPTYATAVSTPTTPPTAAPTATAAPTTATASPTASPTAVPTVLLPVGSGPTPAPTPGHEIKQVVQLLHLSVNEFNQADTKAVYEASYGSHLGIYINLSWVDDASVSAVASSTRRAGIDVEYTAVVPSTRADAAASAAQTLTASTLASAVSATSTAMHNAGLTSSLVVAPTAAQIGNIAVPVVTVPTMAPTPAPADLNQGSADDGSNSGMIVGIVVAVMIVSLIVALGMWFYFVRVPSTPPVVEMETKDVDGNKADDLSMAEDEQMAWKDMQHSDITTPRTMGDTQAGDNYLDSEAQDHTENLDVQGNMCGPGVMFCGGGARDTLEEPPMGTLGALSASGVVSGAQV